MLKMLKKMINYVKKNALVVGVVALGFYFIFGENLLMNVRDLLYSSVAMKSKAEEVQDNDVKGEKQQEPEMNDPSMFSEVLVHNQRVAEADSTIEDIVNEAHK